jgi:regulatory protein
MSGPVRGPMRGAAKDGSTGGSGRPARPPRPVTAAYLERAALHYLERYGASTEMLRRVLARRVDTRCRLRGEDPAPFHALVEPVVTRAVSAGLVDDAAFARARSRTLRRRGGSARRIGAALAAKGIDRETIAASLARADADAGGDAGGDDPGAAELAAARALARRRRLGPHRRDDPAPHRERDLAVLARAGFAYAVARAALEPEEAGEPEA